MKQKSRFQKYTCSSFLAAIGIALVFTGCSPKDAVTHDRMLVVATTGMIKDATENIAGDAVEVVALMGPGVDPHLYKATHGDLERLTTADIVFYNGLHLEGKMGEVLEKLGRSKPVVAITKDIPDSLLRDVPGFQGTHDPHIWFDVDLWKNAVRTIAAALQEHDTINAQTYRRNSERYLTRLDSLHQAIRQKVLEVPKPQRVLITAHDAFGYFGDAYDVEVKGLQGISTVSEFGLKDVTDMVTFIHSRKIKAIFVETSVSQRSIEAVVEGCRQRGWDVKIGGSLYSDAMGAAGTPEGTYIGMVSANVRTIVESLK
ncbi:MAG TPA: zinc ABC transporter substrate-binding protein [Ohtaekwangia sp.]|nr:zinc ABC transporter substrate-binding protein [Ohtaekwangia sp.]